VVGIVITELEIVQIFDKDQCRGGPELRVWGGGHAQPKAERSRDKRPGSGG